MTFSPNSIPISVTGSSVPQLNSMVPESLSDFAEPLVSDPKVSASFLFENILLTNKGEKLSDPNFGVGLRAYLFEPENTFGDLQDEVEEQLQRYALGLKIVDVNIFSNPQSLNSISVSIKYLNPDKTIDNYLLNTDLSSENTSIYI